LRHAQSGVILGQTARPLDISGAYSHLGQVVQGAGLGIEIVEDFLEDFQYIKIGLTQAFDGHVNNPRLFGSLGGFGIVIFHHCLWRPALFFPVA